MRWSRQQAASLVTPRNRRCRRTCGNRPAAIALFTSFTQAFEEESDARSLAHIRIAEFAFDDGICDTAQGLGRPDGRYAVVYDSGPDPFCAGVLDNQDGAAVFDPKGDRRGPEH